MNYLKKIVFFDGTCMFLNSMDGSCFNPLNAKLNPICHLLVFLGAYHIFHVSRIRVKPFMTPDLEFYCVTHFPATIYN